MDGQVSLLIIGDGGLAKETAAVGHAVGYRACTLVGSIDEEVAMSVHTGRVAIGVGSPQLRAKIWARWDRLPGALAWEWETLKHPRADISPTAMLEQGVVVTSGAVVSVDTHLHRAAFVNLNATIGHDATVGFASIINPLAAVSGGVIIGERVLIGAGAVIREGISIGDDAVVGAGAVVVKDVAPRTVVVGNPARPIGGAT